MTGVLADEHMSDVDALVWAVEHEPRFRTTIAALAVFDETLDHARLRHCVDRASRVIPRLRQRVVPDALGIAPPRWSVDPDFRLSYHLRSTELRADEQALTSLVRDVIVQPFDRSRPLWEFTHITGIPGGGSALLLKAHHAVSDGVGGVELMLELFDLAASPDPDRAELPLPPTADAADEPLVAAIRHEVTATITSLGNLLVAASTPRSLEAVAASSRRLGEALGSVGRMFTSSSDTSALPSARSDGLDVRFLSVPLDDLREAGRRFDATINDAFIGAAAMGIADHFRALDDAGAQAPLRISVPISTRDEEAGAGNHWTLVSIELDLRRASDVAAFCGHVRQTMRRAKDDPAQDLFAPLAAGLRRLPAVATTSIFDSLTSGLDIAASNVPGSSVPLHLCGQPVAAMIPFGPLSGCAVNLTLMSHAGTAHIGVSSDPAAVADPDGLLVCIENAFTAITKGS